MRSLDYALILALAFAVLVRCATVTEHPAESVPADATAALAGPTGTEHAAWPARGTPYLEGTGLSSLIELLL